MGIARFDGVTIKEAPPESIPRCPKCEQALEEIWLKTKGLGIVEQKQIVMCPHCQAFVGFGTFSI